MQNLLHLLAGVSLLVWATHKVRTGVMHVFGANLRSLLAGGTRNRFMAALSGMGVTAVVQSSTATALMASAFVGQGLLRLPAALAVMRGADVGTALMALLFSLDLSWLWPLCIFVGVLLFVTRKDEKAGHVGRILIGLGLMLLALRLVVQATAPLLQAETVRMLLASVGSDLGLQLLVGALFAVLAYSSLAVVLLIATMAASGAIPLEVALGLTLGANIGSGLVAALTTASSDVQVRHVTVGNLLFKILGVVIALPLLDSWIAHAQPMTPEPGHAVVIFHLAFNLFNSVCFIGWTDKVAGWVQRWMPIPQDSAGAGWQRPHHLDPSLLSTPSLALSNAVRQALHQADIVESMLIGMQQVIETDDLERSTQVRALEAQVDALYSEIKYYMTKISRTELDERESQRWTEVISFAIHMEQMGDIVERLLLDLEDKNIKRGRSFSPAGRNELCELGGHLRNNLQLAMHVFLHGNVQQAHTLLEAKARFRELELRYAATHLDRLVGNTLPSVETSALHLDMISDFRRINSLLTAIAYPILERAGALAPSRLKQAAPSVTTAGAF